ncbi:MAG TPA: phage tail protein [Clostridia bacterium]|nr:phage tail protein [Clostridia bacterium]
MESKILVEPLAGFKFAVEIDGLIVGGFTEVSGLQIETETEEYREGGVNDFVRKLPKVTKHSNLVLKRGITNSPVLWNWYKDVTKGAFRRRNGSVLLMDNVGQEKWRWNFYRAYPVKWIGPELKSDSNSIAVESLELVHEGLVKGGKT